MLYEFKKDFMKRSNTCSRKLNNKLKWSFINLALFKPHSILQKILVFYEIENKLMTNVKN